MDVIKSGLFWFDEFCLGLRFSMTLKFFECF